jgi:hypothetical protein
LVRGLAPFLELHYNKIVGNTTPVALGDFVVDGRLSNFDELDLTAGVTTQFGDRFNLSMGAVVPLKGQDNRTFDWQFGIRANLFLGAKTQRPNNPYYVP